MERSLLYKYINRNNATKDEKQFCEVLNRLRIGELTDSDNALFMSRIVKKSDSHYISDAQPFSPLKGSARKHNERVYLNCGSEKLEIQADHVTSGNPSEEARGKCLLIVKTAAKYSEVLCLKRVLKVGVGLAYTTSVNIKTDDGLINGATCILKKIHCFKSNASKHPDILWVLFDDETIGKLWRQKYSAYYNEGKGKT